MGPAQCTSRTGRLSLIIPPRIWKVFRRREHSAFAPYQWVLNQKASQSLEACRQEGLQQLLGSGSKGRSVQEFGTLRRWAGISDEMRSLHTKGQALPTQPVACPCSRLAGFCGLRQNPHTARFLIELVQQGHSQENLRLMRRVYPRCPSSRARRPRCLDKPSHNQKLVSCFRDGYMRRCPYAYWICPGQY